MMLLAAAICSTVIGCPKELRSHIRNREAFQTFAAKDKNWNELLTRVGSGEPAWIDAEQYLVRFSDGALRNELSATLGTAVTRQPVEMLKRISNGRFGPDGSALCGNIGEPASLKIDLGLLRRRAQAVRAVRQRTLQDAKTLCLREIQNAVTATKRHFK
ncbi:MAG TPA: hypothetical protein VH083_28055 [Myxococcales bacterium]|jgi:hypothetical protein|nr:hypothetical protein [Myxococcales bacterium]